jgi:hypothetical protein
MEIEEGQGQIAETPAAEAPAEGTLTTTAEPAAQQAPESQDTERRARDMGWVPQEEWHGSPDAWRPADEFVKRGEEVLPIVRSNLEKERSERRRLEKELEAARRESSESISRIEKTLRIGFERQRENLWREFEEKKRAAVADGNMQAYDSLNEQQHRALAEFQPEQQGEEDAAQQRQQPQVQSPPEVKSWVDQNQWFNRDKSLTAFATEEHGRLLREMPGLSIEENLKRTLEATKAKFPEKFGMSRPTASAHAPGVEGGGRQAQPGAGRVKSWNDLPQDAKASADRFIRNDGLFLPAGTNPENASEADINKARAAYAKEYWSQS